jgi:phosphatidylinositol glycan class B
MTMTMTRNHAYPDEYWQGTEVAYNIVYGGVELPWEWAPNYRIRNVVYPYFIAIPLWIIKTLGVDSREMVRLAPYLAHLCTVMLSDIYFYKLAKKVFGSQTAKIAFMMYFTNAFFNSFLIRCFGNSVESTIHLVVFYYFYDITSNFDKNVTIVAFCLAVSMGIRNTSIMGWVPLLVFKMFQKRAIVAFILTAVLVALPTLGLSVLIDSVYYGQLTITAYNFFLVNVFKNLSAEFGTHRTWIFFDQFLPEAFGYTLILLFFSVHYAVKASWNRRQIPYVLIFTAINLAILSSLDHKEGRFMLPVFPYFFIMMGDFLASKLKTRYLKWLVLIYLFLQPSYQVVSHKAWSLIHRQL